MGTRHTRLLAVAFAFFACDRFAEPGKEEWEPPPRAAQPAEVAPREACAHRDPQRQAFFGDLHVHTGFSMDARTWGLPATPDDAYRYATGEEIEIPGGRIRIDRPLDFAAVTDHAEWLAEVALCTTPGSATYDTSSCRIYRGEESWWVARLLGLEPFQARVAGIAGFLRRKREVCGDDVSICRAAAADSWQQTRAAAERWYDRSSTCRFTTFHAWEYSRTPAFTKLHRNVVLRNEIAPEIPFSWIDTPTPEELWSKLRALCTESGSGCDALAIPHNPNLGNGQMFAVWYRELPLAEQREAARMRAELEPLVEMMQIKGESECRNGLYGVAGGPDELCDFEKMRDLPGAPLEDCEEGTGRGGEAGRGCVSRLDYARYALLEGLREGARIGVNPFKLGFIGSTDTHGAAPGGVSEWSPDVPLGRTGLSRAERLTAGEEKTLGSAVWRNPGGLVGIFAEENSRDALFDAMRRRETFATSGPRIEPRFFGGFDLASDLCERADLVAEGYARGVPMGGDLPERPGETRSPVFAVSALRDPGTAEHPGGLLERLQIVKGWVDDEGLFHQRVVDVAGNAASGADVDPATCAPRGPGAASLCAVWRDDDFDPARAAVYYARVVENPSCRWTTWQCNALPPGERPDGCADPRVPKTIQERAWTSPIWYEPRAVDTFRPPGS